MAAASIALGVALLAWARHLEGWSQSVAIEIGASVLLLAPLVVGEDLLRQRIRELDESLRSSVASLSAVRNLLPPGDRRTEIFDDILRVVRTGATAGGFPAAQVAALLEGDSDDRTVALAAMEGNPAIADCDAIERSIRWSGYGNEQYYALRAAEAAWSKHLAADHRRRILKAIDEDDHQRGWIQGDPYRHEIAARLREAQGPQP